VPLLTLAIILGIECCSAALTGHAPRGGPVVVDSLALAGSGASRAASRRLLVASIPDLNKTLNTPSDCSGWLPEKRVYMEAQAWFTR
jgi:hypothetical protein